MEPDHLTPSVRADLFGGTGEVRVWDLVGRAVMPPFAAVLACALDPGGRVGRHVQQACPELVIGLAGRGTATVAGRELPLIAGSVVELPLGDHLAIRNDSDEDALHYLIVKARPAR